VPETLQETAREICPAGGTVRTKVCDASDPKALRLLADEVVAEFGRIDTLVNCAGVNKRKKVEEYDEETYDFITNINIRGAFFLATAVGRHMIAAGRGSVINIDSINSHRPLRGVGPYAMSKAAMSSMTRTMAMEWGPHGVRVNSVAPGFTLTDLARPLWKDEHLDQWRQDNTPLRRPGTAEERMGYPEDMVGVSIFLASKASSFITGQVIYVDGGTTCGLFWPIQV
jgi:NAD(P)-dependent dehydrogenase (short-subunit alcohol dehydrogenase family)